MSLVIYLFCCFLLVNGNDFGKNYNEEEGEAYLRKINSDIQVKTTESVLASWAYESNITDSNLKHQLDVSAKLANYTKEVWKETIKYPWKSFKDPDVRRQFQKFSVLGTAILSPEKYERYNKIISDMQSIYGKSKVCSYYNRSNCSLQLEPELTEIFVKSRNPEELLYYWKEWRNAAGKPVREMYKEYVKLSNEAAVLNNFTNSAEFWLKDYEASDFKEQVEGLWQQLRPLYLQLHAFVRRRLREQYGEQYVTKTGPIPAHLLGNMWAQSWGNIFDLTVPYPGKPSLDVTPNMVEQGYTPLRMFKLAEEFFTSLNLSPMPESFWKNSILEKPADGRDLICHASAWDFYDGEDFRIKQCTRVTMEDLNTVHHEMGHIQYFLQYKNQPLVYKEGTNPGFHEAVGDVMALSVSTPKHLRKIGLLNNSEDDAESEINQLFSIALDKIAFLPFGYLMDQWRWSVFEGKTTDKEYNSKWWQLREKYQGISPSVTRTEEDFDPGAKYHTVGNVPYIRYFVSFVIQFQFHRSLCIAAKEYDPSNPSSKPLHKCDIYQSKEAGELLKKTLQMGSSKPWPDAMEVMTGQRKMDASALLEYFATLKDWLEKENARTGEYIGWESSQKDYVEEEEKVKSSDSQGNFEDDNVEYSCAEFVRQDDNAFGFPDFLEEIQPSYQALRRSSKENGENCLLLKRNSRRFSNNPYQPESSHLRRKGKELVRSTPERIPSDISQYEFLPVQKNQGNIGNVGVPGSLGYFGNLGNVGTIENQGNLGNNLQPPGVQRSLGITGNVDILSNPASSGSPGNVENPENSGCTNQVQYFDNVKDENTRNLNIVGGILKNLEYMLSTEQKNDILKPVYSTSSKRHTQNKKVSQTGNENSKQSSHGKEKKGGVKEEGKEESKSVTEEVSKDNKDKCENSKEHGKLKGDSLTKMEESCEGDNSDSLKLISKGQKMFKTSNDLLCKAEIIKKEAEKMLKNLNFTSEDNLKKVNEKVLPHITNSESKSKKKARHFLSLYYPLRYFRLERSANTPEFLKTAGVRSLRNNAQSIKPFYYTDLLGVTPTDNHFTSRKKKRHVRVTRGADDLQYIVLIRELPEKTKKRKRSYREYHFKSKSPTYYNSVILNPQQKGLNEKQSLIIRTNSRGLTSKKYIRSSVVPGKFKEQTFTKK